MDRTARNADSGRLVIACPDRPGIVAAVSRFVADHGGNIDELDQVSSEPEGGRYFMRMVFHRPGFAAVEPELRQAFASEVAERFGMTWRLEDASRRKRVAIMASREEHCALDLLWRWRRGELPLEIGVVVSNHRDLEPLVTPLGVPFEHVPVTRETKPQAEAAQLRLLAGRYDLVVLARYMQILSGDFLGAVGAPVINIHHSFLPAFVGADPYARAKARGVKLVGATAHYVTEELDAGPIIEQDVVRVTHRDGVEDLVRLGADVERTVLTRAVRWHCEDRVLVDGSTTVVF